MDKLIDICKLYGNDAYYQEYTITANITSPIAEFLYEINNLVGIKSIFVGENDSLYIKTKHAFTFLFVTCTLPQNLFDIRFRYCRNIDASYKSKLTFYGGRVKYFYGTSEIIQQLDSIKYLWAHQYSSTYKNVCHAYYYSVISMPVRLKITNVCCNVNNEQIKLSHVAYNKDLTYRTGLSFTCKDIELQEVLKWQPRKIYVKEGSQVDVLFTSEVYNVHICDKLSESTIQHLLNNQGIKKLTVSYSDEPNFTIHPHTLYFRCIVDEKSHYFNDIIIENLMNQSHNIKSARKY